MESDFSEPPGGFEPEDDKPAKPVALVSTQTGIPLRVEVVEDDRTPQDMVCMGTIFRERLIARSAVPPEVLSDLEARGAFTHPVRLGLAAVEEDPGLQCRLFALLPAEQFREEEEPEEPWTASVPRYEDTVAESEQEEHAVVPLLLGHIVRFQRDRKHPEDLAAEAVDVLRTLLSDEQPPNDMIDKVLDDLLS